MFPSGPFSAPPLSSIGFSTSTASSSAKFAASTSTPSSFNSESFAAVSLAAAAAVAGSMSTVSASSISLVCSTGAETVEEARLVATGFSTDSHSFSSRSWEVALAGWTGAAEVLEGFEMRGASTASAASVAGMGVGSSLPVGVKI